MKNLPFSEKQKIPDALQHHSQQFYSTCPKYSNHWLSLALDEIHLVYSEKKQRKHRFNHVQYNMDISLVKLSKDYLYLSTEEMKCDI